MNYGDVINENGDCKLTILFTILIKVLYKVPSTRCRRRSYNRDTNVLKIIIGSFIFIGPNSAAMVPDFQRISNLLIETGKNSLNCYFSIIVFRFQYHHYVHIRLSLIKVPWSVISYLLRTIYTTVPVRTTFVINLNIDFVWLASLLCVRYDPYLMSGLVTEGFHAFVSANISNCTLLSIWLFSACFKFLRAFFMK